MKSFNDFPLEIRGEVFDRLPAKSWYGENKVKSVCKSWQLYIERNRQRFPTPNQSVLIEECTTPEAAVALLRDKETIKYFPYEDILRIAHLNPHFFENIPSYLKDTYSETVGRYDTKIAIDYYYKNIFGFKTYEHVYAMAKQNAAFAEFFYSAERVKGRFLNKHEIEIFSLHWSTYEKAQEGGYSGLQFPKIYTEEDALAILKNTNLVQPFLHHDYFYTDLGGFEKAAHYFLNNPHLHAFLNGHRLMSLGIQHLSIAERIFADTALLNLLTPDQKGKLAVKSVKLSKKCFEDFKGNVINLPSLLAQPRLTHWFLKDKVFVRMNEWDRGLFDAMRELYSNEEVMALCENENATNFEIHYACCKALLNNPEHTSAAAYMTHMFDYKALLEGPNKKGIELVAQMLNVPSLSQYIGEGKLVDLALASKTLGMIIIRNPGLFKDITYSYFRQSFYLHCVEYAMEVLQRYPEVFKESVARTLSLRNFCEKFPKFYKENYQLQSLLKASGYHDIVEVLESKCNLVDSIQSLAEKLSINPDQLMVKQKSCTIL